MAINLIILAYAALAALILFFPGVNISAKIALFFGLLAFHAKVYDDFSLIHGWIALSIIPVCLTKNPKPLFIILGLFAATTIIQFYMFDNIIRSIEYLDWSRKLPPAFAILIVFIYLTWNYMEDDKGNIASFVNHVGAYVITATVFFALFFSNGVINEKFDLWQNNPNDTSLICVAAWLHILFHHDRSGRWLNNKIAVSAFTFLAILVTVMASSRWLSIFIVGTFIWWAVHDRASDNSKNSLLTPKVFFFGTFASVLLVATWAAFGHFLQGSFLQLNFDTQANGIKISLLWEGYQGYAPLRSSIGYRINGVFAAIGTILQSWGLGIGVGRSVALNGMITGYPGSLHVVVAEWMLELGIIFPVLVWLTLKDKMREAGIKLASATVITALLSMMAQTTGYITHYFVWFVFVSLVYHDLPQQRYALLSRRTQKNQALATVKMTNAVLR